MSSLKLYPIDRVEDFDFMVSTEQKMMNLNEVEGFSNVKVSNVPLALRNIPMADGANLPAIQVDIMGSDEQGSMGAAGRVDVEIPAGEISSPAPFLKSPWDKVVLVIAALAIVRVIGSDPHG
jgi:hypothetical protein